MNNKSRSSLNPCVALLWDWQNVRANPTQIQSLSVFVRSYGKVVRKEVYSDWRRESSEELTEKLYCEGFKAISVPSYKNKPNRTDRELIQDCRKLILNRPDIKTVILLSNDGDFTALVNQLKGKGKTVIVITHDPAKTNRRLTAAASEYRCFSQIEQWFSSLKFAA